MTKEKLDELAYLLEKVEARACACEYGWTCDIHETTPKIRQYLVEEFHNL